MKKIILILTAFVFLTTASSVFSQIRKEEAVLGSEKIEYAVDDREATFIISMPKGTRLSALYPSYATAVKDVEGDILPSFEQIGFIGKTAFEKIRPSVTDMPAGESNFLDQVFLSPPPIIIKDPTEKGRLSFTEAYERRLEDAFHTKIANSTAITSRTASPPAKTKAGLKISPRFKIEPLPAYYMQVGDAFGSVERAMKRATKVTRKMREFFYAMRAQSLHDTGLQRRADVLPPADDFILGWKSLPEMALDVRTITPIGPADPKNPSAGTRYRAVLGIEPLSIEVSYDKKPSVTFLKNTKVDIGWAGRKYAILVPVTVEVVIRGQKPITSEEFITICDKYKTKDAIVSALKITP